MIARKKYRLPTAYNFDFQDFLAKSESLVFDKHKEELLFENMDMGKKLLLSFERMAGDLLTILDASKQPHNYSSIKETATQENPWIFDSSIYRVNFTKGGVSLNIVLVSTFNGHMGYNEESFKAQLSFNRSKFTLQADLFLNDFFSFEYDAAVEQFYELENYIVKFLDLRS